MKRYTSQEVKTWILFQDEEILVCHKPAGLAVQHASFSVPDLESLLKNQVSGGYLAVIHRLDQPVEGVLVFARTPAAAAALNRELTGAGFLKEYLALVHLSTEGESLFRQGEPVAFCDTLLRDGKTNTSRVVASGTPGGKEARLTCTLLERQQEEKESLGLVKLLLDTGRHHQIRVQLSHRGCPILGDRKYGFPEDGASGLALCARRLSFRHPRSKETLSFQVEPAFLSGWENRKSFL